MVAQSSVEFLCAGMVTAIAIALTIWVFVDADYYHTALCSTSLCSIFGTRTCNTRSIPYTCYNGMFSFWTQINGQNYTNGYVFSYADRYSVAYYNICINGGTAYCTWDDRDINNTFAIGPILQNLFLKIASFIVDIIALAMWSHAVYVRIQEQRQLPAT